MKKFNNILRDYNKNKIVPVDPVCGIEMDETLALVHEYDGMKFDVKLGDKKYLIASLNGRIHFEKTSECLKKKKEIINEIVSNIKVKKQNEYEFEKPK